MGIVEKIACWIATLGPVGYLPAPGSWGTLCAVPVMYALSKFYTPLAVVAIVSCLAFIAWIAVSLALPQFAGYEDPSQIVIDEFIGYALLACTLPLNLILFIAGFFLFRFFDIIKPFGIKKVERLHGVMGLMCDDLVAALYAGLVIQSVMYALLLV